MTKKYLTAIFAMLLFISGCISPATEYEKPVQFYYCAVESGYDVDSTAIQSETRECAASGSIEAILNTYLSGPQHEGLRSPFPAAMKLISFTQTESVASITLSEDFSSLAKLELTLACGCIAMTVLGLTDVETVNISAENALLNGQQTITMNAETLQLLDIAAEGQ